MDSAKDTFDYIVVGGGLAGCTLASLLSKSPASPSVLLIEAGADVSEHPLTQAPMGAFAAHGSDIDWNYQTVPQTHLNNRSLYNGAGKALGGGTAINYASWTRGSRFDYDRWAGLVGDSRWGYDGLLPYFEKIETDHITNVAVSKSSPNRKHPLRERVLQAWLDLRLENIDTANSGEPLGVGEFVENWRDGKRQLSSNAFELSKVTVMTETVVQKVVLEERTGSLTARGVQLHDGSQLSANKEVILSAGAYRTPQLLLLSGIGPAEDLQKVGIPVHLNLPAVGKNLHDHLLVGFAFPLKDPSAGFALGGAAGPWADPAYQLGLPGDWIATENVPRSALAPAVEADAAVGLDQESREYASSLLDSRAAHFETVVIYVPGGPPLTNTHVPFDGTHIGAVVAVMSPTSRGQIGISTASALDPPVIDPQYNKTEVDRALMRYGIRRLLRLARISLADIVTSENPPPPFESLSDISSDSEIDARVRSEGRTFFHAAGTASMGQVVDTELRVVGVDRLRVVDASVLPVPIGAHPQVAIYALAAQAADMLAQASS
ncbi:glucose dehydrogenase [Cladophialophora carrionii]|uniref:Glucose dehydrogenase n=1 Tax=Cladophialophora carrionii TaxID=86049 RepID=A0A1C1CMS8_9EURO|nr:glucose dehydrogenase [Cladophialophora carrionii]